MTDSRFSRDELTASAGQTLRVRGREYKLEGKAGEGAIGVVRKARNMQTGAQVAIKFLAPELKYIDISSLEDIHTRFKREGERGASLKHDNLVEIIGYEENTHATCFTEGNGPPNPFLMMELIQGRTLENYIKLHSDTPGFNINLQTLHIAHCIVKGLLYLHERNIVHRDVKPANIYVSKAVPNTRPSLIKLGDFGVVKWGDFKASVSTGALTMTGQIGLGTFKYMSPEQATHPKDVSVRSDMYSLGITLFELFTNQILPSPHHVFQITQLRMQRGGNIVSKLHDLGLGMLPNQYEELFSNIFDMFLTGPTGRPSSRQMEGRLRYMLELLSS